jgi:hypothetical protein
MLATECLLSVLTSIVDNSENFQGNSDTQNIKTGQKYDLHVLSTNLSKELNGKEMSYSRISFHQPLKVKNTISLHSKRIYCNLTPSILYKICLKKTLNHLQNIQQKNKNLCAGVAL